MLDSKVWCDNFEKFFRECEILENYDELKSKHGDIKKSCMSFLFNKMGSNGVGIIVSDNKVSFTCLDTIFETRLEKELESFDMCRKYEFSTLGYFLKTIHKLKQKNYSIDYDFNELMDYFFNDNSINGYYLFIDYVDKFVHVSKFKEDFDKCKMLEGISTIKNDLEELAD